MKSQSFFFFFNDTATTEIYTLSLHDALPPPLFGAAAAPSIRARPEKPRGRARRPVSGFRCAAGAPDIFRDTSAHRQRHSWPRKPRRETRIRIRRRSKPAACPCRHRPPRPSRSEEHTSELQSRLHLVCRLLLEKKKKNNRFKFSVSV